MMNKKKIYLTISALLMSFGVLVIFYVIFFSPVNSEDNIQVNWISTYFSELNSLMDDEEGEGDPSDSFIPDISQLNFPLEIDQRGSILFSLFGEVILSEKKSPGLLIPAVKGARVQVIFNGELILDKEFPREFEKSSQLMYSHIVQINPALIKDLNKVIIQYQSRDKLEIYSAPYFGDYIHLKG